MPEGHKVFRIALDHDPLIDKRIKVSSPQGRFSGEAKKIDGRILRYVESYGKHLVYHWSGKIYLHVHLGLYGKYRWLHNPQDELPRGQVRVRGETRKFGFELNGPNQCRLLNYDEVTEVVERLGPDPLRLDSQPHRFQSAVRKSASPIATLLLDQKVIAGIGNIYRSEILYLLGIHPLRPGHSLSVREIGKIWNTTKRLLKIGVKYNTIITAEPRIVGKSRANMASGERLLVYKKTKCVQCKSKIAKIRLNSRSVYMCKVCQSAD